MRTKLLIETLKSLIAIRRPVYITSAPGAGKTSVTQQVAEALGMHYEHIHAPNCLVEDFGVPDMGSSEDTFRYKLPERWKIDPDVPTLICLDDRGQCAADIQKIIANIIDARELHGHAFADSVAFVSTGNRIEDRAGANRVLSHLADRETELEFDVNLDDWCEWAIDNGVHPSVITFVRFRPNLLHSFDAQKPKNPTPRSWVKGVSAIIDTVPAEAEYDCFKGAVGEGAAAEFAGFREIERKLPNIDNLLMHPDTTDVPNDPATLYAISGAIAHKATNANFDRVIRYADRMPPEFGVLTVSYATRRDESLSTTQAFTTWAVANQSVLW